MQLLVEVKGAGFHFTAATDQPQDVVSILNVAMAREAQPGNSPQLPLDYSVAAAQPPDPPSLAQATGATAVKQSKGKKEKVLEMPPEKAQEAAAAAAAPETPPAPVEAAQGDSSVANGHPTADQIRRDATQACVDALTRNRVGVQALLTEFGVSRFRDLGDNLDKLQAFQARVSAL